MSPSTFKSIHAPPSNVLEIMYIFPIAMFWDSLNATPKKIPANIEKSMYGMNEISV